MSVIARRTVTRRPQQRRLSIRITEFEDEVIANAADYVGKSKSDLVKDAIVHYVAWIESAKGKLDGRQ